jgi:hypothetical protein
MRDSYDVRLGWLIRKQFIGECEAAVKRRGYDFECIDRGGGNYTFIVDAPYEFHRNFRQTLHELLNRA